MTSLLQLAAPTLARAIDPNLGIRANEDALYSFAAALDDNLGESIEREARQFKAPADLPVVAWMWLIDAFHTSVNERVLVQLAATWQGAALKYRPLDALRRQGAKPERFEDVVERTLSPARSEVGGYEVEPLIPNQHSADLLFALLQLDDDVASRALSRLVHDERAQPAHAALKAWMDTLSKDVQSHWSGRIEGASGVPNKQDER